jgi:hypothetical protein
VDIVVVDYRNICKICSYSILSGTVACSYPTEPEEIAMRLTKRMYCFRADYPDAMFVIASDHPPYWRTTWMQRWYNDRGLEPVIYKGNRQGTTWPFATDRATLDALYATVLDQLRNALQAVVIEDEGLEADDIWGLIASTEKSKVLGISTDSDWQQLCSENVSILHPGLETIISKPTDIRIKCICGDRGDNVLGCNKRKKDGSVGTSMWGMDGATKLVATELESEWTHKIETDVYRRNYNLIKLPTPLWDTDVALHYLSQVAKQPEAINLEEKAKILDGFGLTAPVRKLLDDASERAKYIKSLRIYLQDKNKSKPEPEQKDD